MRDGCDGVLSDFLVIVFRLREWLLVESAGTHERSPIWAGGMLATNVDHLSDPSNRVRPGGRPSFVIHPFKSRRWKRTDAQFILAGEKLYKVKRTPLDTFLPGAQNDENDKY